MINWFKYKFLRRPVLEMTMGELCDKRSIFQVKRAKNIQPELHREQIQRIDNWLYGYMFHKISADDRNRVIDLMTLLYQCNNTQFDFEDQVIELGGEAGLRAAKNSREWNQRRAGLKKEIDQIFGEKYLEVKKYSSTKHS